MQIEHTELIEEMASPTWWTVLKQLMDLGEEALPTSAQATPMTYSLEETGRQYVVIAVGGHYGLADIGVPTGDYIIAFALPPAD